MADFPVVIQKSGGHEVIASGAVFTFSKDSDIDLVLKLDEHSELVFKFLFESDDTEKQDVKADNIGDNEIRITCRNFDNPLGTGLKEALTIGRYKEQPIYMIFEIYGTKTKKKLEYCFFMDN